MNELNKMLSGEWYDPSDEQLSSMRSRARELLYQYNHVAGENEVTKRELLGTLLGTMGNNTSIHANFYCDYGCHIHVGANFFANYNCVILDCAEVRFGDDCMLGPQVGIYTATHPLDPTERVSGIEAAKPIIIGNKCWIGGHATINPGVTLGDNVVVASGSVVTKSFGGNVVIGGNPARVLRELECG